MQYEGLDQDDMDLLVLASSSASLDASPNKNWVEKSGGLPPYVRKLARGIMKSGKSKSQAIAIAISQIKRWAAGGEDVEADTRAKAAKALAQWEATKAKNKARRVVKATHPRGGTYLALAAEGGFDTDVVRRAWEEKMRAMRRRRHEQGDSDESPGPVMEAPYAYIRSLWTTFIVVEFDGPSDGLMKIPYTVTGDEVTFGPAEKVRLDYVEVEGWEADWDEALVDNEIMDDDLTENEILLLGMGG